MRIIDCSKDSHLESAVQLAPEAGIASGSIAAEHRMDVYINERLAMRLTCTPAHLDELAVGRLLTEGLISRADEIQDLYICEQGLRAKVTLPGEAANRFWQRDALEESTCCTDNRVLLSGGGEIKPVRPIPWKAEWILDIAESMNQEAPLYKETHAVHACYLAMEGRVLCCREDIGRHNALDKAIGWACLNEIDLQKCLLFTTGRMPADMVNKAIRAGVPVMASKTFPSDRGIALARQARLTLITLRPGGNILVWTSGKNDERNESNGPGMD